MTSWVAGADGCRDGWVVALRARGSREPVIRHAKRISEVFSWDEPPEILCIDIPIGLLDRAMPGGRECDRRVRSLLGLPRACCVFSPPVRAALGARSYEQANRWNRRSSEHGLGISRQCFGILRKIREVDELLCSSWQVLQERVIEAHPEVTFYEMNGGKPMRERKKSRAGRMERMALLDRAWGCSSSEIVERCASAKVARDDILDAMAVCWTAERALAGTCLREPHPRAFDSRGLRMEIVR